MINSAEDEGKPYKQTGGPQSCGGAQIPMSLQTPSGWLLRTVTQHPPTSLLAAHSGAIPARALPTPIGKRLQQELMTLMISDNKGISVFPDSDSHFKWAEAIHGAADTYMKT